MLVGIVYNEPERSSPQEHLLTRSAPEVVARTSEFLDSSEIEVLEETELIEKFLCEAGYDTVKFAAYDAFELASFLKSTRPDIVFNCCESFRGRAALEMSVAGVYELFGIPYTGSSALALGMALDKSIAKALFHANEVPTAPWTVFESGAKAEIAHLHFPVIVKPLREDASIGIDEHSVVHDEAALRTRVEFVCREFDQPAIVEEFIDGREVNLALLACADGFTALPISEILFQDPDRGGSLAMLTYESKWFVKSQAYQTTVPSCPADLPLTIADQVRSASLKAARAVGIRDYGRIDLRIRRGDDAVFVLEVNPNPDITQDSGFVRAAAAGGWTHAQVVCEILESAVRRSKLRSLSPGRP
jgi:D-alanine-D-alanine ligase